MSHENQTSDRDDIPAIEVEEEDLFDYAYEQPGSVPGTLNIEEDAETPEIILIDYSCDRAHRIHNFR